MDECKHYIRVDANNIIIHGFSDAFEEPITGDIQLTGDFERHFQIQITNLRGQYLFKWENGSMASRSQSELDVEWDSRPPTPKTELEKVKEENAQLTTQIIDLWETLISAGVL